MRQVWRRQSEFSAIGSDPFEVSGTSGGSWRRFAVAPDDQAAAVHEPGPSVRWNGNGDVRSF